MNSEDLLKLKGWDFFDAGKQAELKGRQAAKSRELDTQMARLFLSQEGRKVLQRMVQQTILRPTVTASSTQFQAGIREGQNDLVRQILAAIERSKEKP